jgi:hypothetical protein
MAVAFLETVEVENNDALDINCDYDFPGDDERRDGPDHDSRNESESLVDPACVLGGDRGDRDNR